MASFVVRESIHSLSARALALFRIRSSVFLCDVAAVNDLRSCDSLLCRIIIVSRPKTYIVRAQLTGERVFLSPPFSRLQPRCVTHCMLLLRALLVRVADVHEWSVPQRLGHASQFMLRI